MNYEAVMIDTEKGHFRRGLGATPLQAVTAAFRKILKLELPEDKEQEADNLSPHDTLRCFQMTATDDEYMENPKTLKEEVPAQCILIRVDKTKDVMWTPCGWVRPVLH